jgi:hypothetical protein
VHSTAAVCGNSADNASKNEFPRDIAFDRELTRRPQSTTHRPYHALLKPVLRRVVFARHPLPDAQMETGQMLVRKVHRGLSRFVSPRIFAMLDHVSRGERSCPVAMEPRPLSASRRPVLMPKAHFMSKAFAFDNRLAPQCRRVMYWAPTASGFLTVLNTLTRLKGHHSSVSQSLRGPVR